MANIVALRDDKDEVVWVNPAWVKMVFDRPGVGSTIEFMDGHQVHLAGEARRTVRSLNKANAPAATTQPTDKPAEAAAAIKAVRAA